MKKKLNKSVTIFCNSCKRDTNHKILLERRNKEINEQVDDEYGEIFAEITAFDDWVVYECLGCEDLCLSSTYYHSEIHDMHEPPEIIFFPRRKNSKYFRSKPHWYKDFLWKYRTEFVSKAYEECYLLLDSTHYLSAMLTARALLETISIEKNRKDKGTFAKNIKSLQDSDFLSGQEVDILSEIIYDAGSATMHRKYAPNFEAVSYVLDALEIIIYRVFIQPEQVKKLKSDIPQRKKKKKKK